MTLSKLHCFNHSLREAVARCLECNRYFCRECIIEHKERVICAECLERINAQEEKKDSIYLSIITRTIATFITIFILWFTYYAIGEQLQKIPTFFQKGRLFEE